MRPTLRVSEEDRLYGTISLSVRATISYRGGQFQRDMIDDAVQNSLDELLAACPNLTAADAAKRADVAIDVISDTTTRVLEADAAARKGGDKESRSPRRPAVKVTAADLSQELSSQERWLDPLPPRERALSLFLYASNVTPEEITEAAGEEPGAIAHQLRGAEPICCTSSTRTGRSRSTRRKPSRRSDTPTGDQIHQKERRI